MGRSLYVHNEWVLLHFSVGSVILHRQLTLRPASVTLGVYRSDRTLNVYGTMSHLSMISDGTSDVYSTMPSFRTIHRLNEFASDWTSNVYSTVWLFKTSSVRVTASSFVSELYGTSGGSSRVLAPFVRIISLCSFGTMHCLKFFLTDGTSKIYSTAYLLETPNLCITSSSFITVLDATSNSCSTVWDTLVFLVVKLRSTRTIFPSIVENGARS